MTTTNGLYGVSNGYYPNYLQSAYGQQSASTPQLSFKGQLDSDTFEKKEGMGTGTKLLIAGLVIGGGILAHKAGWFGKLKNLFSKGAKEGAEQGAKEISKQTKEIADALPEVYQKQMKALHNARVQNLNDCKAALKAAGVDVDDALLGQLKRASDIPEKQKVLEAAVKNAKKKLTGEQVGKLEILDMKEGTAIDKWLKSSQAYDNARKPLRDYAKSITAYGNATLKRTNAYNAVVFDDGTKLADKIKAAGPDAEKRIFDAVNDKNAKPEAVIAAIKKELPDIEATATIDAAKVKTWIDASKARTTATKVTEATKANVMSNLSDAGNNINEAIAKLSDKNRATFFAEIEKGKSIGEAWQTAVSKLKDKPSTPTLNLADILKIS